MNSTSDPATRRPGGLRPPHLIYGMIGLLVAVLLMGTGAFIWLSSGGTASLVGGPFVLEDGNGKLGHRP